MHSFQHQKRTHEMIACMGKHNAPVEHINDQAFCTYVCTYKNEASPKEDLFDIARTQHRLFQTRSSQTRSCSSRARSFAFLVA
jgi:hypothetical protein